MLLGTIVNGLAILLGGMLGLCFKRGIPKRFEEIIMSGIAIIVGVMGIEYALLSTNFLMVIISIVIGAILGEWIDIEAKLNNLGETIKKILNSDSNTFVEGMITATLLYCVGSMAIMGSLDSGITGDHSILYTKAVMDGITTILLANSMGIGVIFSVIPLIAYQGTITILANIIEPFLETALIQEVSAVGGILLIGLALSVLEIKKVKVANLLPAMLVMVVLYYLF